MCEFWREGYNSSEGVLDPLQLGQVTCRDGVEEWVAVVKPATHKGIRQSCTGFDIEMFTNPSKIPEVVVATFYNTIYVTLKIQISIVGNAQVACMWSRR